MTDIKRLAEMIKECDNIVFFGGAGVSTESGVKDYRSEDGLYSTVKEYGVPPEQILSRSFFRKSPEVFYDFFRKYFIKEVEPNAAHKALAKLEEKGKLRAIITQNIDNLHQRAGSRNVIELHGNVRQFYCDSCGEFEETQEVIKEITDGDVPICKKCGGVIRPRVVMYQERLHPDVPDKAIGYIAEAEMLIIGGTSLAVDPAASFTRYFQGKYLVILNKSETVRDGGADLVIRDNIGEVFEKVMAEIEG
ncbi:MAG: NAD-dependent protein deacylase [Clostridia bacterium]|nr:NAD-dependent protein deacylase [Clostridia bacterium]